MSGPRPAVTTFLMLVLCSRRVALSAGLQVGG